MRGGALLSLVVAFLSLMLAVTVMAQMPEEDEFEINSTIIEKHTRPIVVFNHTAHLDDFGIDCTECHHIYKGGENVWEEGDPVKKCQECHNDPTTKNELRLPPHKRKLNVKWAFHKNCRTCHVKYNQENNTDTAPVRCQSCHAE